jgi:hypothetical protein
MGVYRQEFDASQLAFWDLYAWKAFFSLRAGQKVISRREVHKHTKLGRGG